MKARFVSAKAEYVLRFVLIYNFTDILWFNRAKIKEAGGVVSLIA